MDSGTEKYRGDTKIVLPFLKSKAISGAIMQTQVRPSDYQDSAKSPEQEDNSGLLSGAADLIKAIQADDPKAAAEAFKALFTMLEAAPHDEASHEEDTE